MDKTKKDYTTIKIDNKLLEYLKNSIFLIINGEYYEIKKGKDETFSL